MKINPWKWQCGKSRVAQSRDGINQYSIGTGRVEDHACKSRLEAALNLFKPFDLFVLISLFLCGCATFQPKWSYRDIMTMHRADAKEQKHGLEISVEEFLSSNKSRQVFDADIARHGVLALFLRVDNTSEVTYILRQADLNAIFENQTLQTLSGIDAARQAGTSEIAGKAAAWTLATGPLALVLWPATISGSGSHTQSVNQEIEKHFQNLELGNVRVRPGQTTGGFLYFKLPDGVRELRNLTLAISTSEEDRSGSINYKIQLPPIDSSADKSPSVYAVE